MSAERGHPPSRPQPGPPPAQGGPRRLPTTVPPGAVERDESRGLRRAPAGPPGSRPPAPRRGGANGGAASVGIEPIASRGPRRLAKPKPVRVQADNAGRPLTIGRREVDAVRESWLVEDRWWTDTPLRRRYWEVVTGDGRDLVVFRDLEEGLWYSQR
ncbi:hypothetical protein DVA67_027725 [Solirubrobacter sp. CPCC 204708]|nr:hypothetical protein [Solirubrobacter deserti]